MKTLLALLAISVILTSCEGPTGPPGPRGNDGGILTSKAFELKVNFTKANKWEHIEKYGFKIEKSDVVVAYILWETKDGVDIWRPLPQTKYFTDSELVYNFDYTINDVRLFLEGNSDFETLNADWTQNQTFRIVVIPADNVDSVNLNNMEQVIETYGIKTFDKKY